MVAFLLLLCSSLFTLNTSVECEIGNVTYETSLCNEDGNYNIFFNFQHANTSDSFKIILENAVLGKFAYTDLPVSLNGIPGTGQTQVFHFQDLGQPNCTAAKEVHGPDCSSNNECDISNITYTLTDCNGEGNYWIHFNFEHQNTSDSFKVYSANTYYGTYAYSNLPITIYGIAGNGQGHGFLFKDKQNLSCAADIFVPGVTCPGMEECDLSNLSILKLECNLDNQFNVKINFNHTNTGTTFKIQGNGNNYGTFNYADLPVIIGPFNGLVTSNYEFVVKDIETPDCNISGVISAPYCQSGECDISNITYNLTDCNGEGNYWIHFNFDHQNTSDSFYLYSANALVGTYAYSNLPITVYGIAGNGVGHGFLFKDKANTGCAEDVFVPGQDCNGNGECDLSELVITKLECNANNQFNVKINFDHVNTSGLFTVQGNGNQYGTFSYANLPIILGPFNGNSSGDYEFVVKDAENPNCNIDGFITGPYCENNNECHLYDVAYNLSDCDNNGKFSIYLSLSYQNTSDSFKLYIENEYHGTFAYTDMPVQINGLNGNGQVLHYWFKDAANPDCKVLKEITSPNCNGQNECNLSNLNILKLECNNDGQFNVKINFDHENTSLHFTVQGNGQSYGTFSYADLPIIIGPFNGNINTSYEFVIKDLDQPGCKISGFITGPYCNNGECQITSVAYETSNCDDAGNFKVYFNLQYQNASDSFNVYQANNELGTFAYADLPISFGPFPGNGETLVFFFKDFENPNCAKAKEVHTPDCSNSEECDLSELSILKLECNNDGQFNVKINFAHENTGTHFTVKGNGQNYGTFSYNDLPVIVGPLNGNVNMVYEFIVRDTENEACFIEDTIHGPYCDQENCHVFDISYNLGNCNPEGYYKIYLNFQHENTSNQFKLYVDNVFKGIYTYASLPIEVGPFLGNGEAHTYLIKDAENGDCKTTRAINGPQCIEQNECEIGEVEATVSNCDEEGNFYVELNFDYTGVSDSFKVQGNGVNYGFFAYTDVPVVLGPFDGASENSYEFGVKDRQNPDCKAGTSITPPYCENGFADPIMQISLSNIQCIDEESYYADVDINHEVTGNVSVNLWEENKLLGQFMTNSFPRQITLKNDVQPRVKINETDAPGNFAIKVYSHPDCLLATDKYDEQNLLLFPNPTSNEMTINWNQVSYVYNVFDVNHRLVMKGKGNNQTLVQTENLQPGVYLIQISNGKQVIVRKVIKI